MRWLAGGLVLVFGPMILGAFFVGFLTQPWAPWWIGMRGLSVPVTVTGGPADDDIGSLPLAPVLGPKPLVSDAERYQLARAVGFSPDEAITATAISIAENGGGNPAAVSAPNVGRGAGTVDIGLWQVNSSWIGSSCGVPSMTWLFDPLNNARAAHCIYGHQGWCAWSVYDARCGPGHTGSYANNLGRARAATLP